MSELMSKLFNVRMACITVLFLFYLVKCSLATCKPFENDVLKHLGPHTPYRFVANFNDSFIFYPGCHPVKIFGLFRHGTRTPKLKNCNAMRQTLLHIKSDILGDSNLLYNSDKLCEEEKKLLKNWEFHMDTEGDQFLTNEGESELLLLGRRFKSRFPSLFTKYYNDSFLFRFTKTQRAEKSAKYFTMGLFGSERSAEVSFSEPLDPEPVLRFYKVCKKWKKDVRKNPISLKEVRSFIDSNEMHDALRAISERLGITSTLNYDSVYDMYLACGYETSWFPNKRSAWCSPFHANDMKVLEYADELKYYWRDGYGFEINHKQSCPLFKNIMDFLVENNKQQGLFYFTHSGTLLKALTHLGLYKDPFQLFSNTDTNTRESRLWRTSLIDTFASNLAFVLFRCDGGEDKVFVTHNERQVHLAGCPTPPSLCPLSEIKKLLSADLNCNFEQICSV